VSGWDKGGKAGEAGGLATSPGPHLLSVWTRRPFDGARHAEDMSELLGAARPHYVLSLTPTHQDGLSGGFLRV
jgi:hypothetical protein